MFSVQVNSAVPSDATGERVARDSIFDGVDHKTAFAVLYAALLGLSDEPCSATGMSNSWLDTDIEGGIPAANDSEVLGAAVYISSGMREYSHTGTHSDNEPTRGHFGERYSGSSMDRLMSHGRAGQFEAAPSLTADRVMAAPDTLARKNVNAVQLTDPGSASAVPSNSTEEFDTNHLSAWMDAHALSRSSHHCAMYCRMGMEAAGLNTGDRPQSGDAGDYGPFLLRHGAHTVPQDSYRPQVGDVVVFDKTGSHPHGHIEMYDGQHWVSDFMQHSFSPYRDASSSPPFTIYRLT